jgi:nitroimidazol reductase NimA-like FMN-containing flavoprotein (pyridoxamine 5'-phosphate oxidase superfamily)
VTIIDQQETNRLACIDAKNPMAFELHLIHKIIPNSRWKGVKAQGRKFIRENPDAPNA